MDGVDSVNAARQWRLLEVFGLAAVGVSLFAVMVINATVIPPVLIFGIIYLALGYAVYRWIDRPRVALAAAVLGLLGLLGNVPFLIEDLAHLDSWGSFAPSAVSVVLGVTGIIAGLISYFLPSMAGSRPFGLAAVALAVVVAVGSVGASLSASSDAAEAGDVEVLASGVEYPETLAADAGLIAFHLRNEDLVRHTFVIGTADVKLEVPASKDRRVEVELAAGEYRYICDVPGHERMEGTLTVR
ncbi:MAG: cupredoxin domain-containing protein [Chloroflexi bacterium]|nr:cupredoxin domain-containing protein [Chloroflexota bacterium]MDA1145220.1 cupredoxin domain-containing protein [Chloroflexota bacterium]